MTLKDESLLTAYLDGELEPDERSSIESALLDDPELARGSASFAAVHELIAGLPRPRLAGRSDRADRLPDRSRPGPSLARASGRRRVFALSATVGPRPGGFGVDRAGPGAAHQPRPPRPGLAGVATGGNRQGPGVGPRGRSRCGGRDRAGTATSGTVRERRTLPAKSRKAA